MRIHRHRNRAPKITVPDYLINERIKAEKLRVIDENKQMLGVLDTQEALKIAKERELDLVEVSPKAEPPVAKILDFGQFKYQKEKELKAQKAKSKEVEVKGVRLSLRIAVGDRGVRMNSAKKFLNQGNKVRVEMILRGREKAHFDLARQQIMDFVNEIKEEFPLREEQPIKRQGGKVTTIVTKE